MLENKSAQKRKLIEMSTSQKRMKTGVYFTDKRILPRVKQYLSDNKTSEYVDVGEMAESIQKLYPEYNRKKKNAFKLMVQQAYDVISEDGAKFNPDLENLEDKHLKKRKKQNYFLDKTGMKEESDFSDDNPNYITYEDNNNVNNSLMSLYNSPAKKDQSSCVENDVKEVAENAKSSKNQSASSVQNKFKSKTDNKKVKKNEIEVQESNVTFADIGGNEKCLEDVCKLLSHIKHPEIYQQLGVIPPRGFLLHGPPGCGKTLLAHAISGEMKLPFIKVAATEIVSGVSGESEQKIRELFDRAVATAPCILFIDEIDAITPRRETAQREMERRIVSQLLTCMDDLNQKPASLQVFVIGATNRPDALDPALRRAGRFDREICMGIPDRNSRERILKVLCKNLKLKSDFDFEQLSHATPGYVGADLMALTREASMHAVDRIFQSMQSDPLTNEADSKSTLDKLLLWLQDTSPLTETQLDELCIEIEDFHAALKVVQPSALREGFATIPNVTWSDVGALHNVREELQLCILAPVKHAKKFEALGLTTPAGVLLCGPPGCGKTLLAKAVANESGINFISVKGPELLNMYVGESERAVRQCFQRARNSSPCVIFFDELDALCPRRTESADGGSSVRVVNQLLTEMDGLESRKQVFIMGATNRPDIIDPAMLRPGRLDKILYVNFPSVEDREDILKTITKNGKKPLLNADVNFSIIAQDERVDGFTGADLTALVREASVNALRNRISGCIDEENEESKVEVSMCDFEAAFSKVKPSVSTKDRKFYEKMKIKSVLNESKAPSKTSNTSSETNFQVSNGACEVSPDNIDSNKS